MKPILYEPNTGVFNTNGIGILNDVIACVVTQQRNGVYEAELKYPMFGGIHFEEIKMRSIILILPDNMSEPQPMRVYKISKPMKGVVTINCRHIVYDLMGLVVSPFTATSIQQAFSSLKSYSSTPCPFTFSTDKDSTGTMEVKEPIDIWSLLGSNEGSILNVYGDGEYEFDGFNITLHKDRGYNRGVEIRYGKNLTDLTQEQNCEETYSGVYPYWVGRKKSTDESSTSGSSTEEDIMVQLDERILSASGSYDYTRIYPLNLSDQWDEPPTQTTLKTKAREYMKENSIGVPKVSLEVSFVSLEQTEEYKDLVLLEQVGLCDIVNIYFEKMGVTASAKVIEIKFDSILERYESITLGEAKTDLAKSMAAQGQAINNKPSNSSVRNSIYSVTSSVLGAKGGAVRMLDTDGDNYPDTLYIGDDPNPTLARKVWRFNYQGWAASSTGFNGPFTLGATLDDGIKADFIKSGVFDASLNKTGILKDSASNSTWDMSSGTMSLKFGGVNGIRGAFRVYNNDGNLTSRWDQNGLAVTSNALFLNRETTSDYYVRYGYAQSGTYDGATTFGLSVCCDKNFTVKGTKSRLASTEIYGNRLQYSYETPTPMFGDLGSGQTDETGVCIVMIDDIFYETISQMLEYQVFLQKEGAGDIWISEKTPTYFVVSGTPNLKFSWELKAAQKGYDNLRLDDHDISQYEYHEDIDYEREADNYIRELLSEMEAVA